MKIYEYNFYRYKITYLQLSAAILDLYIKLNQNSVLMLLSLFYIVRFITECQPYTALLPQDLIEAIKTLLSQLQPYFLFWSHESQL